MRNLLTSDLSTDDQLQQLSLVFDDETANEVEVSEKTLTFKISTETRPCQWRPIANALSNTRRASLAVTPAGKSITTRKKNHEKNKQMRSHDDE